MKKIILLLILNGAYQSIAMQSSLDLPDYCERHSITVPGDFWRFWGDYTQTQNQDHLRTSSLFNAYNTLLWEIYIAAKAEKNLPSIIENEKIL